MRLTLKHFFILISSIVIIAILSFLSLQFVPVTRAGVYHLYATSCLGGWENPHLASGMPEVGLNSETTFNADNSAKLNANIHSQIYCGGFSGDILENTIPQKIVVRFSWAIKRFLQPPIDTEIMVSELPELPELVELPELPELVELPELKKEKTPERVITLNEYGAMVVEEIRSSAIDTADNLQKNSQELTNNSTLSDNFVSVNNITTDNYIMNSPAIENFAVEIINENIQNEDLASTEYDSTPTTTEPIIHDSASIEKEALSSEKEKNIELKPESTPETENQNLPIPSIISPITTTPYGFLEVLYTLDGIEWKSLGFIQEKLFRDTSFEIPIEEASDWEDVSKIQIGIRSLPVLDGIAFVVYLDSVWIEAEYAKNQEVLEDPFIPPGEKEGDIILSEVPYENMIAVFFSRKSKNPTESPTKELWLASISYVPSKLDDKSISATTSAYAPQQMDIKMDIKKEWMIIAGNSILSENPRIIFEDYNIFWVGKSDAELWRFNTQTRGYSSVSLSKGEPAQIYFEGPAGEDRALEASSDKIETLSIIDVPVEENQTYINY